MSIETTCDLAPTDWLGSGALFRILFWSRFVNIVFYSVQIFPVAPLHVEPSEHLAVVPGSGVRR